MTELPAGTDIVAFRAVKMVEDFSMTVIPVYPASQAGAFRGFAQHAVSIPPGGTVRVADREGDLCRVEAGGPIAYNEQLTTDELGRVVPARPGQVDRVRAFAKGSASAAGEIINAVIAPKGLTT
jgi:hypothetical protein